MHTSYWKNRMLDFMLLGASHRHPLHLGLFYSKTFQDARRMCSRESILFTTIKTNPVLPPNHSFKSGRLAQEAGSNRDVCWTAAIVIWRSKLALGLPRTMI
jgi:hypothetical protein